jgi:hypothetical protein
MILAILSALALIGFGIIIATLARMPAIMNPSHGNPMPRHTAIVISFPRVDRVV